MTVVSKNYEILMMIIYNNIFHFKSSWYGTIDYIDYSAELIGGGKMKENNWKASPRWGQWVIALGKGGGN